MRNENNVMENNTVPIRTIGKLCGVNYAVMLSTFVPSVLAIGFKSDIVHGFLTISGCFMSFRNNS